MFQPPPAPNGRFHRPEPVKKPDQDDLFSDFESCMNLFKEISDQKDDPDLADETTLVVKTLDLDIENNTKLHSTEQYDITDKTQGKSTEELLVVRRGQSFDIVVHFNRPYDKTKDDLRIIFQFGIKPIVSKRSHVEFVLSDKDTPNEWGGWIKSSNGNSTVISIMTPPSCYVGKWKLHIDIIKKKDDKLKAFRYKHKDHIYILFNPWCKDDSVYMADDALRKEYVLNDKGKLYYGTSNSIGDMDWVFGQYEDCVLDLILSLIDKGMKNSVLDRGNAVQVSRALSALVNNADDNGILWGNWSGDYKNGKSPTSWTGSYAILEEYNKTKSPVKYGQCWVFSGVLTTACRSLGIPCRSLTNFNSAHDTNSSMTIDVHFDKDCEPIEKLNEDSIWNFHVWNDVWMTRPDLPAGYGGWQAIDATPQETSAGMYQCGPASLKALKKGEVQFGFDAPFIFSEANADRVYWMPDSDGVVKIVRVQQRHVGQNISTKMPGSDERQDITLDYKNAESSAEERRAVMKADLYSSTPRDFKNFDGDVEFALDYDCKTKVGDDLIVHLRMKNTSNTTRTINGSFNLAATVYTGVQVTDILKHKIKKLELKSGAEEKITHKLTLEEYLKVATDNFQYRAVVSCKVDATGQVFVDMLPMMPLKPNLILKVPATAIVNTPFTVEASFTSNMNVSLDNCCVMAEGPGLHWPKSYYPSNVAPRGTFHFSFDMTPRKVGTREIVVEFNSLQLEGITGSASVVVSK